MFRFLVGLGNAVTTSDVLILGDDPHIGAINKLILTEAGYMAQYIPVFSKGKARFQERLPDLLVMQNDPYLATSRTVAFYQEIRNCLPTVALPIVIVRCEYQKVRTRYTVGTDSALVFLPIIYSPDALVGVVRHLIATSN